MFTRTMHLVLIVILVVPVWSVQADCGCDDDRSLSSEKRSACSASTTCCGEEVAESSCCGSATCECRPASDCQCGDSCHCGESDQRSPDQPATPPNSNAAEDLLRLLTAVCCSFDDVATSPATFARDHSALDIYPRTAQQACVELNRFLL